MSRAGSGQIHPGAFTAVHPELGRVGIFRANLGVGPRSLRVHPRIALTCPERGFGVHATVRLTGSVLIFVRSAHEAERILSARESAAERVLDLGFPDHEQLQPSRRGTRPRAARGRYKLRTTCWL